MASVGPDRNLVLPLSSLLLDGSGSTDDHGVVSYQWEAVRWELQEHLLKDKNVVTDLKIPIFLLSLQRSPRAEAGSRGSARRHSLGDSGGALHLQTDCC